MKTIFEKLNEKELCYAVMVSFVDIAGWTSKDYCIIAHEQDSKKLKGLNFESIDKERKLRQNCDYDIKERNLNESEIIMFKNMQDDFIKVKQDKTGRIYELKNKGFKKYYSKLQN